MHNSNKKLVQISLQGDILPEEKYSLLCFVNVDILRIQNNLWFLQLNSEQINFLDKHLSERKY